MMTKYVYLYQGVISLHGRDMEERWDLVAAPARERRCTPHPQAVLALPQARPGGSGTAQQWSAADIFARWIDLSPAGRLDDKKLRGPLYSLHSPLDVGGRAACVTLLRFSTLAAGLFFMLV